MQPKIIILNVMYQTWYCFHIEMIPSHHGTRSVHIKFAALNTLQIFLGCLVMVKTDHLFCECFDMEHDFARKREIENVNVSILQLVVGNCEWFLVLTIE